MASTSLFNAISLTIAALNSAKSYSIFVVDFVVALVFVF